MNEVTSTCESGWDFSSRFMDKGLAMKNLKTTNVAPVDLNAIICRNFKILSDGFLHAGITDVTKL